MKSVLIFSWFTIGSVDLVVNELRRRNLRTVLVSELPDDPNTPLCDDHVLFDWDSEDVPTLAARLDQRGIEPIAVVNMVDKLIATHRALAAHYDLPGGDSGRDVLASKVLVRDHIRTLGLSTIRYTSDPDAVDFFPAIIKPAQVSMASFMVGRVDSPAEVNAYRQHLTERGFGDTKLIIEEYLPGIEFSLDGPVVNGHFYPLLTCEKRDHDEIRHHDGTGLKFHPPQQENVRDSVQALGDIMNTFCGDLCLDQIWLNVEGRVTADNRMELIEINPRPGGTIMPLIYAASGIEPIGAFISMVLGEFKLEQVKPLHTKPILGMFLLESEEIGTIKFRTTADELRALPGVLDVLMTDGYKNFDMDKENYFLKIALEGDSEAELRASVAAIRETLDYQITAPTSV